MFFDLLFLFVMTLIHFLFFKPTMLLSQKLLNIVNKELTTLTTSNQLKDLNSILMNNQEFVLILHMLLKMILLFFLLCFAAWVLIKFLSWFFTHKIIYPKIPFTKYFGKFFLISIIWFSVILAFILASVTFAAQIKIITIILWVLLLVISYFALAGFALIPAEKTFKKMFTKPIKKYDKIIPNFILGIICLAIAIGIPIFLGKTYPLFGLLSLIVLGLPLLTFGRLSFIISTWQKK